MNKRLYKLSRRAAYIWFFVTELLAILGFINLLSKGAWIYAALMATVCLVYAIYVMIKGPITAPVILEITDEELIWRMHFYVPTKILRIRINAIREIKIFGPKRDRRFWVTGFDGSYQEIRPYFGFRTLEAVLFLRNYMPKHVSIIEEEPSSLMSDMRGNY